MLALNDLHEADAWVLAVRAAFWMTDLNDQEAQVAAIIAGRRLPAEVATAL